MIRKTALLAVALFALLATSASAHTMDATATCGSVTLQWLSFNDGANGNALNNGENTPSWTISFTPDGSSTPILTSGTVTFGNMTTVFGELDYSISEPIPAEDGTLVVTSSWTAEQTSDGYASTSTVPLDVTDCVGISTSAAPASATAGSPIDDVATLTGGSAPTGTLTWSLYGPGDAGCSGTPLTTTAVPVDGDGDYTSPPLTPTVAGTFYWVAAYSGDANNPPQSTACGAPNETVTIAPPPTPSTPPPAPAPSPSFTLQKLETVSSSGQPFTPGPITANPGQVIDYEIVVTNTGPNPLSLALVDTMCTSIGGPTGDVSGGYLAPGGTATYTCVHVVTTADFPTYVNVAQVTATPPGGSALPPQRSTVVANVPRGGVSACVTTTAKLTQSRKGNEITATVSDADRGKDITKVEFLLDGRRVGTLTRPNLSGGRFELRLNASRTRYGAHRVTAAVSMVCGPAQVRTSAFQHAVPANRVSPKLTG